MSAAKKRPAATKKAATRRHPTPHPTRKKGPKTPAPAAELPAGGWKAVFLAELSKTGNVSAAARKAKVNRDSTYAARDYEEKQDPTARAAAMEFARAWDNAMEVAIDALEAEARRRAVDGTLEPVGWYKGESGGKVRRYSDTLLIVLLKGHRPEKYRENIHTEHAGAVAVVTSDEMARARKEVADWETQRFGTNGNGHHEPA